MNKSITLLLLVVVLLLASGCSPPTIEEAQVDFCQALENYGEAVGYLQDINEQTTIDELNEIRTDVSAARDDLLDSATTLRTARLSYTEDAWANLEQELNGIPGDMTLGEAADFSRIEIAVLLTEIDRVYNVSCGRR